ncbi:ELWxxDGT repeat protein [Emticicia sp. C21]|uniref:ELWxxDGT repeat protein n=1 Tax=Emticicia sp. C21 TaxID=2302915 RepID=UPI000E347183|nr:ELWxxDGT repeat protein [Emticicia sp. C21]RFS14125.1 hypothetical protein D0T08_23035 [Emticicia sp. C21]
MKRLVLLVALIIAVVLPVFSQRVLKDIAQGTDNARVFSESSFSSNDTLFFTAADINNAQYAYYLTNSTSASTKKISGNSFGYSERSQATVNYKFKNSFYLYCRGIIYQLKNDSVSLIRYLNDGNYSSFRGFFQINNQLYFLIYKELDNSFEYWKTDGTEIGTVLIKTLTLPRKVQYFGEGFYFKGKYYYSFNDGSVNFIVSDGTINGTTTYKNNRVGIYGYQAFTDYFYFHTADPGGLNYRTKLWKCAGDSTSSQKALFEIDGDTTYSVSNLFKFKNNLHFISYTNGQIRISKFDTVTLNVNHITNSLFGPLNLTINGSKLYYSSVSTDYSTIGFYENNGSLASNTLIFSMPYNDSFIYNFYKGENNYYVSQQKTENGQIIDDVIYWIYNGSTLVKLTDIVPDITLGIYYNAVGAAGDIFYFSASDSQHGYELWRTDGTTAGTYMIKDINSQIASSYPKVLFGLGNYAYLMADDKTNGVELWKSNGTSTSLHANLNQDNRIEHVLGSSYRGHKKFKSSYIIGLSYKHFQILPNGNINHLSFLEANGNTNFHEFKDSLYYMGNDNNLWKTNGTPTGTKKAVHLDSTNNGTGNIGYQILNNTESSLFFTSDASSILWKTNGTKSGTLKLHEFKITELPFFNPSSFYSSWTLGNLLIFERRNTSLNRTELWRSDGTVAGTFQLATNNYLSGYGTFNNQLYFRDKGGLWKTNGTQEGTLQINEKDFLDGKQLRDKFYLVGRNNSNNNIEYYEIDKHENLKLLTTISDFTEEGFNYPSGFTKIDDRYLLNYISTPGYQHFVLTDGNAENTKRAFSLKGSIPFEGEYFFTYLNKKIYFTAVDSLKGQELWVWDFECPDGYTIRDNIIKDSTIVYGKNIWGQNIISNNKTITYDAKNSIILQPGFEVQKGTVFKTKLIGCANNISNAIEDNIPAKNEPAVKVKFFAIYPQLIDFLNYYPNQSIKEIYQQAVSTRLAPITWEIATEKDIYLLDLKIGSSVLRGFLPKKN